MIYYVNKWLYLQYWEMFEKKLHVLAQCLLVFLWGWDNGYRPLVFLFVGLNLVVRYYYKSTSSSEVK